MSMEIGEKFYDAIYCRLPFADEITRMVEETFRRAANARSVSFGEITRDPSEEERIRAQRRPGNKLAHFEGVAVFVAEVVNVEGAAI